MGDVVDLFGGKRDDGDAPPPDEDDDDQVEVLETLEALTTEARSTIAVLKWWLEQPVIGPVSRAMYDDQWARCVAMRHGQFVRFVAAIGEPSREAFQMRIGYYWAIVAVFDQRVSGPVVQARPPRRLPRPSLRLVREAESDDV